MTRLRPRIACVALAALVAVTVAACGDDNGTGPVNQPAENGLVFTRADKSVITFPAGTQLTAWCGPWDGTVVTAPAVHLRFAGPAARGWLMKAVVADVKIGVPLTFPNMYTFNNPRNVELFILDDANELSTQQAASSGSITFQQLNCAAGGRVEFTIAATVGSEFNGSPSVSVAGKINAPIGAAPR